MARCPFAIWRPLPENSTEPRIDPTQFVLHSAVDAKGPTDLYRYFARLDVYVESHFWVRLDGTIEQFLDTERQADANYTANARAVSVETEDDGSPNSRPWTPEQMDALVRLGVWLNETHGIPARLCPRHDAPGIGYHSMWGAPGAWTPASGKTCPGTARIPQVPEVIERIAAALEGDAPAAPKPAPKPAPAPQPKPAPKTSGPRLLKRGMEGADVRALQVKLNSKGLARLKADGVFGPVTEGAVKDAQRRLGVGVDGIVGPKTRAALDAYRKPATPTIKRGSKGKAVSRAQELLGGLVVDGKFGPKTEARVKAFQRSKGLVADGIIGPKTWRALDG